MSKPSKQNAKEKSRAGNGLRDKVMRYDFSGSKLAETVPKGSRYQRRRRYLLGKKIRATIEPLKF
ncbi:uncharacterized protein N7500_007375 [Penicillium coprophilum]|uniref:uncharacterized protein n=1 Tax=Penicillium coprophilum TaxID=36646 RepID=UPI0023A4D7DE|nr:uncharacterized protein N7500_007375 [Penicillium coprophilum]KAJ5165545.1 hypothetical protein N7500_007375 [Penicillium coprophilum]